MSYLEIALRAKMDAPVQQDEKNELNEKSGWPPESYDFERRFAQPHAKLFPFLGRKVRTPSGPGTLIQVFADHVIVVLDAEVAKCSFFAPGEISPVSEQ
jgi:hypothetical protein